jgi:hypothetical protein
MPEWEVPADFLSNVVKMSYRQCSISVKIALHPESFPPRGRDDASGFVLMDARLSTVPVDNFCTTPAGWRRNARRCALFTGCDEILTKP